MLASGKFLKNKVVYLELTVLSSKISWSKPGKNIGSKSINSTLKKLHINDSFCVKFSDPQLYNCKEHITKAFCFFKSKKEIYTEKILQADISDLFPKASKVMSDW